MRIKKSELGIIGVVGLIVLVIALGFFNVRLTGAIIASQSVVTAPSFANVLTTSTVGRCDMSSDTGGLGVILNGRTISSYEVSASVESVFNSANAMYIGSSVNPSVREYDTSTGDIFGSTGAFVPMHIYAVQSSSPSIGGTCRFSWTIRFASVPVTDLPLPAPPPLPSPPTNGTTGGATVPPPVQANPLIWLAPIGLFGAATAMILFKRR